MTGWQPKLVALDIDGTLLKWVEGSGQTHEEVTPAVYDAVHRVFDAGAHVVLASGRSPHGMTRIADLLELHGDEKERLWVVASNGAVVFRYPPVEVVHEETFDARAAVATVLEHPPEALVAAEERGHGLGDDQRRAHVKGPALGRQHSSIARAEIVSGHLCLGARHPRDRPGPRLRTGS